MEFTIQQISEIIGGKIEGDGSKKVKKLGKIQDADSSSISFLSNLKYENFIYTTEAAAVIVDETFVPKEKISTVLIKVPNSYTAFSLLLEEYHKLSTFNKSGIEQPCYISESATIGKNFYRGAFSYIGNHTTIGENVKIYPNVYIGDNVKIGNNVIFHSGVKIYAGTSIGNNCIFHAGSVVGSDGFGYAPLPDGTYKAIPQIGNVIIEDNVDIGANSVIDCATMGSTMIRNGVKIDNLVQIAHNVEVGKNTVIAALCGIAGSSTIGENCVLAGQVGVVGHINIPNKSTFVAKTGVTKSYTEQGKIYAGYPAIEHKKELKNQAAIRKLPELLKRFEELEEKVIHLLPLEQS